MFREYRSNHEVCETTRASESRSRPCSLADHPLGVVVCVARLVQREAPSHAQSESLSCDDYLFGYLLIQLSGGTKAGLGSFVEGHALHTSCTLAQLGPSAKGDTLHTSCTLAQLGPSAKGDTLHTSRTLAQLGPSAGVDTLHASHRTARSGCSVEGQALHATL